MTCVSYDADRRGARSRKRMFRPPAPMPFARPSFPAERPMTDMTGGEDHPCRLSRLPSGAACWPCSTDCSPVDRYWRRPPAMKPCTRRSEEHTAEHTQIIQITYDV